MEWFIGIAIIILVLMLFVFCIMALDVVYNSYWYQNWSRNRAEKQYWKETHKFIQKLPLDKKK